MATTEEREHQEQKSRKRIHNEYLKRTKENQIRPQKAAVKKATAARRTKDVKRIGKEIFAEMGL